jgi:hypothetical protein
MTRFLLIMSAGAVLFLNGCATDLTPEDQDKPAASDAPDPMNHIQRSNTTYGGAPI